MFARILARLGLRPDPDHEHDFREIVTDELRAGRDAAALMPGPQVIIGYRCSCGAVSGRPGTEAEQRRAFDPLENARAAARMVEPGEATWSHAVDVAAALTRESGRP